MVIKRVFEIAEACEKDVHADLGCGDGRLNFAAVGGPSGVSKSWGVDIDPNILEKCRERLGRRFVPSGFSHGGSRDNTNKDASSEAERLEFLQADLIRVVERQKEKHQQQLSKYGALAMTQENDDTAQDWSKEDDITEKLAQSTVVTMYFVHDALQQIQPYLASTLGGKENVRLVTVGYEMKGWDATWVERVLGLTIFKYDMKNVSNDPLGWRVKGKNEVIEIAKSNDHSANEPNALPETVDFDGDYSDVDESSAIGEYLRQKREQDVEELNNGLRIHHDEKLNDFAQSRSMQKSQGAGDVSALLEYESEDYEEEGGWDFDETEDPEELMKEAHQTMAEVRMGGRGKGMMAGLDVEKPGGRKGAKAKAGAKPVWKKP